MGIYDIEDKKPKMSKKERDELMKKFLDKGGKIQKLKPGAAAVLGSLDKSKKPAFTKEDIEKVLQVKHLHLITKVINPIHTTTMTWVVINHLYGKDNQRMRWEVNNKWQLR